jgi:hypothetical protein
MWNWLSCYLSGRHDYSTWCEPGAIFLRCIHCGRRSAGWSLDAKPQSPAIRPSRPSAAATVVSVKLANTASADVSRVLPFVRGTS